MKKEPNLRVLAVLLSSLSIPEVREFASKRVVARRQSDIDEGVALCPTLKGLRLD